MISNDELAASISKLVVTQKESQDDIHKLGVLYEATQDDVKKILEAVTGIQQYIVKLPTCEEFDELKDDVTTIKAAVTDTSNQVHDHEKRITRLEVAV